MSRAWAWYGQQLHKRPILTKSLTAGAINTAGDVIAQVGVVML